jgi:hypothetical protein
MQSVDVSRFVKTSKKIEGWFSADAARLFGWVDEIQKYCGVVGDLFEIGCHHGKSARLLGAMARPDSEVLAVCDLFGMQADNVSRSGHGDRDVFESNMQPVRDSGVTYKIFQKNSLELVPSEIGQRYRIFHVDGGHNPDEALADLKLAASCLVEKGVIALDDPFRIEWPGVTEALIRFLDEHTDFEAIIVGCNKVLLTRRAASAIYTSEFERHNAQDAFGFGFPWKIKSLPFHHSSLRILYVPDYRQKKSLGNLIRRIYYATPLSKIARKRSYTLVKPDVRGKSSIA